MALNGKWFLSSGQLSTRLLNSSSFSVNSPHSSRCFSLNYRSPSSPCELTLSYILRLLCLTSYASSRNVFRPVSELQHIPRKIGNLSSSCRTTEHKILPIPLKKPQCVHHTLTSACPLQSCIQGFSNFVTRPFNFLNRSKNSNIKGTIHKWRVKCAKTSPHLFLHLRRDHTFEEE